MAASRGPCACAPDPRGLRQALCEPQALSALEVGYPQLATLFSKRGLEAGGPRVGRRQEVELGHQVLPTRPAGASSCS